MSEEPRATCWRCRRPQATCWCGELPSFAPRTRVVIVQHPREADTAIGTARMVHLALAGSTLLTTLQVGDDDLGDDFDVDGAVLLYPSDDAISLEAAAQHPPKTLVVVDGTWSQAKKLIKTNPRLMALPKLAFVPPRAGNYRIRKEPSDAHWSTIEAVAYVLGVLEGDVDAYAQLLRPFTAMVDRQLAAEAAHVGDVRARRSRQRDRPVRGALYELTQLDAARAVVVYAEANCDPRHARTPGAPELLHLVAAKPWASTSTPATFEARLRPRRPMHDEVPARLGVARADFDDGEDVVAALARFRAFVDGGPLLCWGPFARDQLHAEGEPQRGFIDLRALAARSLGRPAGGVLGAAGAFGVDVDVDRSRPRAVRMQNAVVGLARVLSARANG
jgi:DTW domain-containing protein YfiP